MNRMLVTFLRPRTLTLALACTFIRQAQGQAKAPLSDLTLSNFFSEG